MGILTNSISNNYYRDNNEIGDSCLEIEITKKLCGMWGLKMSIEVLHYMLTGISCLLVKFDLSSI